MIKLTDEKIKEINDAVPYDQGVYFQPNGVPVKYKEHVVYIRYETGGYSGGSCWDDSNPEHYSLDEVPNFDVLDAVLKELCPNVTYLQYKEVEKLIKTNEDSENEYYGNSTDYMVKYIPLSELYSLIEKLGH